MTSNVPTVASNVQTAVGPGGVSAASSRCVAARLMNSATDDIAKLTAPGVLRCCNCGLSISEDMKLPVRDRFDPIDINSDYVRVPLDYEEVRNPSFELSDFCACTPGCALRYMYDSPDFITSHVPHLFALMMWHRHRMDEPVTAAPPADALQYLYRTKKNLNSNQQLPGLSAGSFYWLLSRTDVIGYKQMAPLYIPPTDAEYNALESKDSRFTQYYFQDVNHPPQVGAKLPEHFPPGGIKLDANPDDDHETDFATDTVHPPMSIPAHKPK